MIKYLSDVIEEMIGEIPVERENHELILNLLDIRKECMNAPRELQYLWRGVVGKELESRIDPDYKKLDGWKRNVIDIFVGDEN